MFEIDFEDSIVDEIDNHPIIDYMDTPSVPELEEMFDRGYFG